jgi:hypothetical protein
MIDQPRLLAKPTQRSAPMKVSGRLKQAIELMVWQGHSRDEAAKAAGLVPKSLYNALRKHHVKAFLLGELGALRTSARARNFHHLESIAANSANDMARVSAVKAMEALEDEAQQRGSVAGHVMLPGLTIVISNGPAPPVIEPRERPVMIDASPIPAPRQPAYEAPPEPSRWSAEPDSEPSYRPAEPDAVAYSEYLAPRDMAGIADPTPPRPRNRRRS